MSFSRKDYLKRHIASVHKDQENIEMKINQKNIHKNIEWNEPEIDLKHEDEHNIQENVGWNEPEIDIKTGEEKQGQVNIYFLTKLVYKFDDLCVFVCYYIAFYFC